MTLLVRDEEDILDAHLTFHLNAGIDYIIATDHCSSDATAEILSGYARGGHVRVIREEADRVRQSKWVTGMARLAAAEHGADWVINSDADEFWWPCGGSLKDLLAALPQEYGIVHVGSRYFIPRPDDGRFFAERMTFRLAAAAPLNDPTSSFRPVAKIAHRGGTRVAVGRGGHRVSGLSYKPVRGRFPIDVLHLPLRSETQSARKFELRLRERRDLTRRVHWRGDVTRAAAALAGGERASIYTRAAVGDAALERGLATGAIVEDTRLRDALRLLLGAGGRGGRLSFGRLSIAEEAAHAADVLGRNEADLVRLSRRVDELRTRVHSSRPGLVATFVP